MAKQPSQGRKPKSKTGKAAEKSAKKPEIETVEDAVVVDDQPAETPDAAADPAPEMTESLAQEINDSVVMTDPQLADEAPTEPEPAPEPPVEEPKPEPKPAPPTPAPVPQQSSSPFLPLVFGGVLAGVIGYGVAYMQYANQGDPVGPVAARVADVENQIASLPAPTDISGVEAGLQSLQAGFDALPDQFIALQDRIDVLERQPSGDGTLQETALAAFEADLDALRGQISDQEAEMAAMVEAAETQLDSTRSEALSIEQNAVDAARAATARAALARVQAAMESGAPIGAVLAELGDTLDEPVPDALAAVADGTPTLAELRETFPEAARAALATARSEGEDGEGSGGIGGFLRSQFEVRSVAPREGTSVDAILSRAEAALKEGRLSDSLAEVASLPEVSRAELGEWVGLAELRAAAVDAADTLASSLNR